MRWRGGRRSDNVEDRRGVRTAGPRMKFGLGTIVLVLVALYFGADPGKIMNLLGGAGGPAGQPAAPAAPVDPKNDPLGQFVSVVLADTEDTWSELFRQQGLRYRKPKLVLFGGSVRSACGFASAAVGPFYCPADENVYIDLSFYKDLKDRHHAPGDFAQAYVIAHEIGHHVQNQLGIMDRVHELRSKLSKEQYNQLQVRLELQADFYAGVWAHHAHKARDILEKGDIEEALNAASQIGDDRLQMESRGYVTPDSFTHGTSAQRARWFRKGLKTGDISQGDTFNATEL